MRPRAPEGPTIKDLKGQPAPLITGLDLDGEEVRLSPRRAVLFFSATWCKPCKTALLTLNERDFRMRGGYQLVYVNKDDSAKGLTAYFEKNFSRQPDLVITDADGAFEAYHSRGIPMMVEVDEEGVIASSGVGSGTGYLRRLRGKR